MARAGTAVWRAGGMLEGTGGEGTEAEMAQVEKRELVVGKVAEKVVLEVQVELEETSGEAVEVRVPLRPRG